MTKTTIEIVNATKQERDKIAEAIGEAAPGRQWHMLTTPTDFNCHPKCNCHVGSVKPQPLVVGAYYWAKWKGNPNPIVVACCDDFDGGMFYFCGDHSAYLHSGFDIIGPRILPPEEE